MEKVYFKVQDGRDITFVGQEVAHTHNTENDVAYRIYETEKGNWILTGTTNENILIQHKVFENKSTDELVKFLGYSDLSKSLYSQLNIDTSLNLDI